MSGSPFTRTTGPQIVRFFDVCFKQGVLDAYAMGDDYAVKEFLDLHKEDWSFGILGEPNDYDWELFRFAMYRWARHNRLTTFAENFIYKIRQKNYLWAFLPYCMRFYILGIEEWLEYPNPIGIEIFKHTNWIHWAPREGALKKITRSDVFAYMTEFSVAHRRLPEDARLMNAQTFSDFPVALYDFTKQYKRHKTTDAVKDLKKFFHEDI